MLTPQEVSERAFQKANFGGYNMAQVDEFLDVLTGDYSALYNENAVLKNKMKVLVDKVEEYRSTEDAMRKALMAAQRMADDLVREAERKRDELLSQADAEAQNRKVDAGTRPQVVNAAREIWMQARAASDIAEKTWRRMEALYGKGVVSAQKRDEAKAAYDAAKAGEQAARSSYELAQAGAQSEDRNAAAAMVNVAKSSVKKVDAILEDQYLTAPFDGEIVVIYPNVSELIATGAPVVTLQKDDHWAVFNVREFLLKDIREGSVIRVRIPALDVETDMKVFYIKDLGTYANWQATKATGDYDARTFQIKARPEKPIENFRPGMSVIYLGVKEK